MKKLILIAAMLSLLSGCVVIESKYTGRSRIRIYNDFKTGQYVYYSAPMSYGWVYVPYGYYYGGVYPRYQTPGVATIKNKVVSPRVRRTVTKKQMTVPKTQTKTSKVKINKK